MKLVLSERATTLLDSLIQIWRTTICTDPRTEIHIQRTFSIRVAHELGLEPDILAGLLQARYVQTAVLAQCVPNSMDLIAAGTCDTTPAQEFEFTELGGELLGRIVELLGCLQIVVCDPPASLHPWWNTKRRELYFGSIVVKRFRKAAPNQELILSAFEESGWPAQILDPLPPKHNLVASVRLHDAINRLNRSMQRPVIRFGGDGTGQGVYWRPVGLDPFDLDPFDRHNSLNG